MHLNVRKPNRRAGWLRAVSLLAVLGALVAGIPRGAAAQTSMEKWRARQQQQGRATRLQAAPNVVLEANLVQCGLNNAGDVCTNIFNSPTGGGGFWPKGTANQYIFNSGLQVAGINSPDAGPWAGDTVGAFFFDATGLQPHGSPLTQIYNSLDPEDLANWPAEAFITDTSIFHPLLIGQKAISDQDTWVKYWDGDPNMLALREHPMGIIVEQRSLAFNAPAGAEHTVFFIYKFTNATNDPEFIRLNEQKFGIDLPDGGWRIDSIYAAFAMDPDVTTNATENFSTAILPFNMGVAYQGSFSAPDFNYQAEGQLYSPPFFRGPGFVGVKYLRSPIDPATGREVGLTLFSNTINSGDFDDPRGPAQLWRYLSGKLNPALGDQPCNIPVDPGQVRKLCYLLQSQDDTRFYQASGPFSLEPGQSATIVVAYTFGPPVRVPGYTPGTEVVPGVPTETPGANGQPIRLIEQLAGWVETPPEAIGPDGRIIQERVRLVRGSVLANAMVAQAIFDAKFLVPRPPDPVPFTLIPGDGQVTITWQPTPSEQTGDPFYVAASDPTSPLYDPNFRQYDVEGYRIYRQTGLRGAPELIAAFDKAGTVFYDYTGQLDPNFVPGEGKTYEQFRLERGEPYPAVYPLSGNLIQYPAGARVRSATGDVIITLADTVSGLNDTGVPFVFVDRGVRNGLTYRYAVTAFDVNSLQSSPTLESARIFRQVIPRASGLADKSKPKVKVVLQGETRTLDPNAPLPTIDSKGRFSGPMPPTNGIDAGALQAFLPQALKVGTHALIRLDSVVPYAYAAEYFFTTLADGQQWKVGTSAADGFFNVREGEPVREFDIAALPVPADTAGLGRVYGTAPGAAGVLPLILRTGTPQFASGVADWAPGQPQFWAPAPAAGATVGGSRWFVGDNETMENPTVGLGHGEIPGYTITAMTPYANAPDAARRFHQTSFAVMRAADIQVQWSGGKVAAVRDVTHDVAVPFHPSVRASYGFLQDGDGDGMLSWDDTRHLDFHDGFGGWKAEPTVPLVEQPVVLPVDVNYDGTADANGFGLYINGEVYFFTSSTGAPPASGTWTLRTYHGEVTGSPDNYTFTPHAVRMPAVPGLVLAVTVDSAEQVVARTDLESVHTVPDPYYVRSAYGLGPSNQALKFVNLPPQAIVRIYSVNGTLVRVLKHDDPTGGGELFWDLRNQNNQFVASGVYFYHVEAPGGLKKVGRFTVIQFAQ